MKARVALAAIAALVALTLAPAQADVPLWRLTCKASGTVEDQSHLGFWAEWLIVGEAQGTCTGHPAGALTLAMTGSMNQSSSSVPHPEFTAGLSLTLRDAAGGTRKLGQGWDGLWQFRGGGDYTGDASGVVYNLNPKQIQLGKFHIYIGPGYDGPQHFTTKWWFFVRPWS